MGRRPSGVATSDDPRVIAARCLVELTTEHRSLSQLLPAYLAGLEPTTRALVQELCFGVARWHSRLEYLATQLLERPLRGRDADVQMLILIGIYQLIYMRIAAHAAVDQTVAAAGHLGKGWARGLVNAVLRNLQRRREELLAGAEQDAVARWAHPAWWLTRLQQAWPADWTTILEANNSRPPMTLRINMARTTRQLYLQRLLQAGIAADEVAAVPSALTLHQPMDVARLPGFAEGDVSVQDAAAQLAAPLLAPLPGERVLDACAAPGGKTCHVLECQPALAALLALDHDPQRLHRISENLQRTGVRADLVCADAAVPATWWDGVPFDRILLDAPCSASGIIRRHPDIKLLRQPADISALVIQQRLILDALWGALRPGGLLLYVTCSILPEENTEQMIAFMARHPEATEGGIDASWGRPMAVGRQILSGDQGMDGFYYAALRKRP
ncbi:MAG: 16S rRNA (cytosine(967)-C(5))-methyltransferase RsmB [Gammaproteobacteria bacterium]|nr:16S rRNA (cytosine(967)-C(5))-methyltransferase RsmB [Gammaproteobacteria bacterium]